MLQLLYRRPFLEVKGLKVKYPIRGTPRQQYVCLASANKRLIKNKKSINTQNGESFITNIKYYIITIINYYYKI